MKELNLPQKIRKFLEDFIERLKNIYRDGLISVILSEIAPFANAIGYRL